MERIGAGYHGSQSAGASGRISNMRALLALIQLLAAVLRPVRSNTPGSSTPAEAYLKPLAILMIGLIAGPDIFVAAELTTILELFGAALFLLTFAVGLRMLGLAALEWLRPLLLPDEYVALIKMRGIPFARIYGAFLVFRINCVTGVVLSWACLVACGRMDV
jgi:hypothetical protein